MSRGVLVISDLSSRQKRQEMRYLSRCYRLPLKLVTWGSWRKINHSARAILPVLGLHADRSGKSFPGIETIMKMSGCQKARTVRKGLKCLISNKLLTKEKEGRHNVYYLANQAIRMGGSYFPMNEYLFTEGWWAKLLPCEKAVFVVLAVKGAIENPDIPEEFEIEAEEDKIHSHGVIQPAKWLRLTGITKPSWYTALYGLNEKHWIGVAENNGYVIYK